MSVKSILFNDIANQQKTINTHENNVELIRTNLLTDKNGSVIITPTSVSSGTILASNVVRCPNITDLSGNSLIQNTKHFLTPNNYSNVNAGDTVDITDNLAGTIITNDLNISVFNSVYIKVIGTKITADNMIVLSLVNTSSDMNGNTGHGLPLVQTGVFNGTYGQSSGEFYIRICNADNASINSKNFTIRFLIIE